MSPQNPDPVVETIAVALAGLVQPDLTTYPPVQVWQTMNRLLTDPQYLDGLRSRIVELSGGMTRLEDADKNSFPFLSHEWGALYQKLIGLFTQRLVIVGNSTPQFMFVSGG